MKNLKKLSRNDLKKIAGGAKKMEDSVGEGGGCGGPCDTNCTYPNKCMNCYVDGGWVSHCAG